MRRALIAILCGAAACTPPAAMEPLTPARSCPEAGAGTLAWYVPQGTDRHSSADAWCRAVGPVVLHLTPTRRAGERRGDSALVVVAWNVNGGSGDLYRMLATELGLDCLSGRPYQGPPFVLLLQEAYRRSTEVPVTADEGAVPPRMREPHRPGLRDDVVTVAARCGLAVVYVPEARNGLEDFDGEREDKGDAILSTVPLSHPVAIEMPMVAQRRVAVGATLQIPPDRAVRAVSIHFNNIPAPATTLTTGGGTRAQQARSLLAALAAEDGRDPHGTAVLPAVAGGDLNTATAHETALKLLQDYFGDSPPHQGQPTRSGFPTDHLFLRQGSGRTTVRLVAGSYRRIDEAYHSDHHPVTFTLRVEGGATR